jgi:hypothetical protein
MENRRSHFSQSLVLERFQHEMFLCNVPQVRYNLKYCVLKFHHECGIQQIAQEKSSFS